MSETPNKLIEPQIDSQQMQAVRDAQRLIDARIVLAEEEVRKLSRERKDLEADLWMEVDKPQLVALLADGRHGTSLNVTTHSGPYSYKSHASLSKAGELLIGGYLHHDHFRGPTVYVRKDLDRF